MDEELENLKRCLRRCATHVGVPWKEGEWDDIPEAISDKMADLDSRIYSTERFLELVSRETSISFPKELKHSDHEKIDLTCNSFGWTATRARWDGGESEPVVDVLTRPVNDKDVSVYFNSLHEIRNALYAAGWTKG